MPAIDAGRASAKWSRVSAQRGEDYTAGVQNPRTSWSAATRGATESYKQGVAAAIARGGFEKGVAATGDAGWQKGAVEKGPARFAQGVQLAQPAYEAGVGKYLQVINATALPPRGPKGDPRNLQRVVVLATALRKAKTG